ncbi:hypothetical protein BB558_000576 [Smittium angustum]|uniref:Autophagy-related protein 101 n=1 Tax=Smittium angustum TaxID=133377 RepID=A0A2U1JE34_SMIAN|nr:hypothetical protein BB558_000576 [Smittium angustum]
MTFFNETETVDHEISIDFYTKITKKAWFSTTEESVCWEKWILQIELTKAYSQDKQESLEHAESVLRDTLLKIIKNVDLYKDHIPLISSSEPNPFPFKITLQSSNDKWSSMLKRIL